MESSCSRCRARATGIRGKRRVDGNKLPCNCKAGETALLTSDMQDTAAFCFRWSAQTLSTRCVAPSLGVPVWTLLPYQSRVTGSAVSCGRSPVQSDEVRQSYRRCHIDKREKPEPTLGHAWKCDNYRRLAGSYREHDYLASKLRKFAQPLPNDRDPEVIAEPARVSKRYCMPISASWY